MLESLDSSKLKRKSVSDIEILQTHHKFIRNDDKAIKVPQNEHQYGEYIAKSYYDKLYKEFVIIDLQLYETGKIGMRWRTKEEVCSGKGDSTCSNKKCVQTKNLTTFELNFRYKENDEWKNALVKSRVCPECEIKMNFKRQHKKLEENNQIRKEEIEIDLKDDEIKIKHNKKQKKSKKYKHKNRKRDKSFDQHSTISQKESDSYDQAIQIGNMKRQRSTISQHDFIPLEQQEKFSSSKKKNRQQSQSSSSVEKKSEKHKNLQEKCKNNNINDIQSIDFKNNQIEYKEINFQDNNKQTQWKILENIKQIDNHTQQNAFELHKGQIQNISQFPDKKEKQYKSIRKQDNSTNNSKSKYEHHESGQKDKKHKKYK